MATHTYECMFILDPNKASSDMDTALGQANGVIERHGGQILFTRPWGDVKLAYPIANFKRGSYLLTYFSAKASGIPAMEADWKLSDLIVRHLVLKLHPDIAKDTLAHMTGEATAEPQPHSATEPAGAAK